MSSDERWSLLPEKGVTLMEVEIISVILAVLGLLMTAFSIGYTVGSNRK